MLKIIIVADGETDYLFIQKAFKADSDLSELPISIIKPEDLGLKRRTGGGHKTLLKDAGLASIKAAQGFADGVFVAVDNDGDPRFRFPHENCGDCRECEALKEIEKINWGTFRKGATIFFQAVETFLLSAKDGFTPQLEEKLFSQALKVKLYGQQVENSQEIYQLFQKELDKTDIRKIRARSYPRMKKAISDMAA